MVTPQTPPGELRSLGQLVNDLSENTSRLVRAEIDLVKAQISDRAKKAGAGGGLLAGAAVLACYAVGVLITAAVLGLAVALPAWAAALIVFGALLLVIGGLVLVGVRLLKKSSLPPEPNPVTNVRDDIAAVKEGLHA